MPGPIHVFLSEATHHRTTYKYRKNHLNSTTATQAIHIGAM